MILIPLILLGGGGGGYLAYSQYVALATIGKGTEETAQEAEPVEYGEFTELDNLIVNPAGSDGKRFLMVKIGLESEESQTLEEIAQKKIVINDTVLNILSSETAEELASIENRDAIKEALRNALNEILTEGKITRLYFTQYVLQ